MKEPGSTAVIAVVVILALLGSDSRPVRAEEPGPSFNCKKAATPVEKAICDDQFLGFRDGALGQLYSGLLDALADRERRALRREQINWLKTRDRRCGKVDDGARSNCLIALYEKRLRRLNQRMRRAGFGSGSLAGSYGKRISNFSGSITIVEVPKGPAWVEISTVNGPTAHLCNLWTKQARRQGATLVWRDAEEPQCKVTLTFKDRTVRTTASRACRFYCGARGYFEDLTYSKTER